MKPLISTTLIYRPLVEGTSVMRPLVKKTWILRTMFAGTFCSLALQLCIHHMNTQVEVYLIHLLYPIQFDPIDLHQYLCMVITIIIIIIIVSISLPVPASSFMVFQSF